MVLFLILLLISFVQVNDGGNGPILNPIVYPTKENRLFFFFFFFFFVFFLFISLFFLSVSSSPGFGPMQLFLSCGSEVMIYIQFVGYGFGSSNPSVPLTINYGVESWTNEDQELFSEAEVFIYLFFLFFREFFFFPFLLFHFFLPPTEYYQ